MKNKGVDQLSLSKNNHIKHQSFDNFSGKMIPVGESPIQAPGSHLKHYEVSPPCTEKESTLFSQKRQVFRVESKKTFLSKEPFSQQLEAIEEDERKKPQVFGLRSNS